MKKGNFGLESDFPNLPSGTLFYKCAGYKDKKCKMMTPTAPWVPSRMIHQTEADLLRCCPNCKSYFQKKFDEHVKDCERYGIPV